MTPSLSISEPPSLTFPEIAFLRKVAKGHTIERDPDTTARLKSLIVRGYCRIAPSQGTDTHIYLTEAGQQLLPNDR